MTASAQTMPSIEKRALERHPAPGHSNPIEILLTVADGHHAEPHRGHLWDLSTAGACVIFLGEISTFNVNAAVLTAIEPVSCALTVLNVHPRWSREEDGAIFAGLELADGPLPQDSFLYALIPHGWADAMPCGTEHPLFPPLTERSA